MIKLETRDQARDLFAELGITPSNIKIGTLDKIWSHVNKKMLESSLYQCSYKMVNGVSKFMTCETHLWYGREAISFNDDGFIGIAGWADNNNVQPILDGIAAALENHNELEKQEGGE